MSAEIFISHASKDRGVAQTLYEALEYRGFGCWIASRDIGPGENFQVSIVRAIRAAKVMILVFSANSNNSEEIKKELVLAGQSRLIVIPVRVEDVSPDEAFSYELAIRQWIDMFDDWERAMDRLAGQLEAIVGVKRTLLLEPAPSPPRAAPSAELARIVREVGASTSKPTFGPAAEIAQARIGTPAAASGFALAAAQNEADSGAAAPCAEVIGEAGIAPTSPAPDDASLPTVTNASASSETTNGTVVRRPPKTASRRLAAPAAIALLLIGGGGAGFWAYSEYQHHTAELAREAQMAQEKLAAERAEAEQRATEAARQKAALEAEMRAIEQARQQAEADRQAAEQKAALEAENRSAEQARQQAKADRQAAEQKAALEAQKRSAGQARQQAEADRQAAEQKAALEAQKRSAEQARQQAEAARQIESLQRLAGGQRKTTDPARQAALAPAKPVETPSAPPALGYNGAIAWDKETGKYGVSWNQVTAQRANEAALSECGASGCKIIMSAGSGVCTSFATTGDGMHAGASWRKDREAARLAALAGCQKNNAGECTVRVTECNK